MEEKEVKKNKKQEQDIEKLKKELKEELKKEVLEEMKEKNQKEQKKDNKDFEEKAKETIDKIMDTEDNTKDYDKKDIESNKGLAMISYLGPLCLVPYLVNKDSKFVKYHAKQGLNLFVIELIVSIVSYFIYSVVQIPKMCTIWGEVTECGTITPWWISLPIELIEVIIFIIAVIGFVFAYQGKAKELPIVSKIKIIK